MNALYYIKVYTSEDLHRFSFTKADTSVPDEPCETPTSWAVSRREENGGKRQRRNRRMPSASFPLCAF